MTFFQYLRNFYQENPSLDKDMIVGMDETSCLFDSVGQSTIEEKGSKTVPLLSTGHEKASITVILAASCSGKKRKPLLVFRGKGKAKEFVELKARKDVTVTSSPSGWANDEVISFWINANFNTAVTMTKKHLLIWDSFRRFDKTVRNIL